VDLVAQLTSSSKRVTKKKVLASRQAEEKLRDGWKYGYGNDDYDDDRQGKDDGLLLHVDLFVIENLMEQAQGRR
jgi:hypothetical protein